MMEELMIKSNEVLSILKCSYTTLYRMIGEGKVIRYSSGTRRNLYKKSEIENLIKPK